MNTVSVHKNGPLYAQVREILTRRIAEGEWQAGEMVPSEQQLARQLNVSQGTVRKAMNELVAMHVLVRQQGKGTFVAMYNAQRVLFRFFNITDNNGTRVLPASRVLASSRRQATRQEAAALHLPAGSRLIQIERIRELGGSPAITETILVPTKLFPDLDRTKQELPNTLYQLYQDKYGVTIHRAEEKLRAVAAGEREADLLNVEIGTPLLNVERRALTLSGKPVELRISRCDTTHYYYETTLT